MGNNQELIVLAGDERARQSLNRCTLHIIERDFISMAEGEDFPGLVQFAEADSGPHRGPGWHATLGGLMNTTQDL